MEAEEMKHYHTPHSAQLTLLTSSPDGTCTPCVGKESKVVVSEGGG